MEGAGVPPQLFNKVVKLLLLVAQTVLVVVLAVLDWVLMVVQVVLVKVVQDSLVKLVNWYLKTIKATGLFPDLNGKF
jgi:hypothetical protein